MSSVGITRGFKLDGQCNNQTRRHTGPLLFPLDWTNCTRRNFFPSADANGSAFLYQHCGLVYDFFFFLLMGRFDITTLTFVHHIDLFSGETSLNHGLCGHIGNSKDAQVAS